MPTVLFMLALLALLAGFVAYAEGVRVVRLGSSL